MTNSKLVLVTGGTGFVGIHCILQLLQNGYRVRTTLRNLKRKDEVLEMLKVGGMNSFENISFVEADLSSDANWDEAAKGCDYVLHVASPIFLRLPKDEDEMIKPAVEGTLRVLKAAKDAGVKRVVITSSFAAIGYSHKNPNEIITEESWTNPNEKGLSVYVKSKALAEKAAWDFIKTQGGDLELATVNPVGIFGPSLSPNLSSGFEILKRMLDGSLKFLPKISFSIVDVRDVADLHLRTMIDPQANGQRFLAVAGEPMTMEEIASLIKNRFGDRAAKVSTKTMPDWLVRIAAIFSESAKQASTQLGKIKNASNKKAKTVLGWKPRSNEEAITASVESILNFGVIK